MIEFCMIEWKTFIHSFSFSYSTASFTRQDSANYYTNFSGNLLLN